MRLKKTNIKMMLLFVAFLGFAFASNATHFRYGNISWEPVQGQANTIKFTYQSAWRYTAFNRTVGQQASIGTFYFGGTTNLGTSRSMNATVTAVNTTENWMICEWSETVTYTSAGDYNAFYTSCCRISTLQNNADGRFRQETVVNVGTGNRPPSANLPPIVNMSTGQSSASIQVPGFDPDGDPISYRLATDIEASGYVNQFTHPTNLSISNTGLLTFNTTGLTVGHLYSTSIVLEDSTTKTMIDFLIRIVGQSSPPLFDYSVTPANTFNIKVAPLQNVNFIVRASDEDSSQTYGGDVSIQASGTPVGATYTPTLPTTAAHVTQTTFNWTPGVGDLGNYVISFFAQDDLGVQTLTSVTISVTYEPIFNGATPGDFSKYCVKVGDSLTYTVQTADLDVNDSVRIKSIGVMSPASSFAAGFPVKNALPPNFSVTNSAPTAYGNPVSTKLTWGVQASDWGIYEVEFIAEDGYSDETVLTHLYLVDQAPVFTSTPITTAYENQLYTYTITATDADAPYGDSAFFSDYRSKYPSWLTLTDNGDGTATLSGTPGNSDLGEDTLRIELHDKTTHYRHTHCTQSFQDFNIQVLPCVLQLNANVIDEDCPNAKDGSIDLMVIGSTGTINYTWSNSSTTEDIAGLSPGGYSVMVSDSVGCTQSDSFTVNAGVDVTPPNVQTKNITVYLDAAGDASITANDLDNGTTDNCGVTFSISNNSFDCSNIGSNNVVFTAADPNGNSALDTVMVTVKDSIAPIVKAKDITIYLDASGDASITANDLDDGTSDNCGFTLAISNGSFDCSNIGSNNVIFNASDNTGASSTDTVIVTVKDTIAPMAKCKNVSITLVNGVASIAAGDVDDGSSDACGVNLSVDVSNFTCANIGANPVTLTVTDNNNNSSTCDATVTVLGSIPTVDISKGLLPTFCQGNKVELSTSTTNGNSISYAWSTSESTSSILAPASGTYSVDVTNEYGCSSNDSITINFDTDSLLSAHTLIGKKEVHLHHSSKVETGGVSALGYKGKIHVDYCSSIKGSTTFAKAKKVYANPSSITNEIESIAYVTLPEFKYNPHCNSGNNNNCNGYHGNGKKKCKSNHGYHKCNRHCSRNCKKKGKNKSNNVTVASYKTVTLTDSIYGDIKIGRCSKVIFTSPVLYINKLETSKNDSIIFTASCVNIYVCKNVTIDYNNVFNPTDKSVLLYVEDHFKIGGNSKFNGSVYSLKHVKSEGYRCKKTVMKGLFIADKIQSKNTTWNWNTTCGTCTSTSRRSDDPIVESDDNDAFLDAGLVSVNVYPNPSNGTFSIDVFSPEDGDVNVTIYDVYGKLVYTTGNQVLNGPKQVQMNLNDLSKGTYFAVVEVNGTLINKKVIIQ